ncbi:glycine dehydrogenase [Whalleya microplaca]|nr:glycine dehydrogenase [Whalleya microplaca]
MAQLVSASARTIPRRLGQLAVQARISSSLNPRLQRSSSWVCHRCTYRAVAVSAGRRAFSSTSVEPPSEDAPSKDAPSERVHSVPHTKAVWTAFAGLDTFPRRHIGPDDADTAEMLKALSPAVDSLDEFVKQVIPADIFTPIKLSPVHAFGKVYTESSLLSLAKAIARQIEPEKSYIGTGYYGTHTPSVIQRNVLENPAWYTSYTPYQPEISQGRLESLLNFQTMVSDLTALPIANSSLLDEGTAAAEAMTLSLNALPSSRAKAAWKTFVVSETLHPQTIEVLHGRAAGFGIRILPLDLTKSESIEEITALGENLVGVMVQYPDTYGRLENFEGLAEVVHKQGALLSVATDLLALTLLKPPGEWGADIAFGSAQRFGVPMGFGGPHAAFFAVGEKYKRKMPGRLVGLSKDRLGGQAYRLALQTREQHIRREKATSNVCTAQALLANMSALYGIYHGPEGLKAIAERTVRGARAVQALAEANGYTTEKSKWSSDGGVLFDTVIIDIGSAEKRAEFIGKATSQHLYFRKIGDQSIGISVDETTSFDDLRNLSDMFRDCFNPEAWPRQPQKKHVRDRQADYIIGLLSRQPSELAIPDEFRRTSSFMTHPVFNTHHSETEILRYIYHLQSKDLSLVHSMIPLGSCTMKLNGTTEMSLISLPQFSQAHPYTPIHKIRGYESVLRWFGRQLRNITDMHATSLQPNSGAQGEFTGLRAIRDYHKVNQKEGDKERDICLIPVSAHGTNPASAAMAGMRVVPIKCDPVTGNLDLEDLEAKCEEHKEQLGAIMITYPSTYGIFEPGIRQACEIVHNHGGLVYMDGANMNAQIGLCSPGQLGADVCHLNLHKTFCIPHGGGGPGVGPICVKEHLAPFIPRDPIGRDTGDESRDNPVGGGFAVSSAKYGSASIALISWAYNTLMGVEGLTHATKITLLNANYLLARLKPHYPILYQNEHGRCAHEFILDARPFSKSAGIEAIDIAKRLQDYGFHAPTMSWPVANTLMIEPTESESREELDRFVDALVAIREEIRDVEEGRAPRDRNVLKLAPHPMRDIILGDGDGKWERSYSREKAAYPLPYLKEKKFWPTIARVDDTYGDLNLFCTCPPVEDTTGDN